MLAREVYASVTGIRRTLGTLGGVVAAAVLATAAWAAPMSKSDKKNESRAATQAELSGLAKREQGRFMENKGQWPEGVQFLGRAPGFDYWVTEDGLVFDHFVNGSGSKTGQVVRMDFVGGLDARAEGRKVVGGVTHFLRADESGNRKTARSFAEVVSQDIYPGIALRSYFDGGKPRYDFVLKAGIDPAVIRMKFDGTESVRVDSKGDLVLDSFKGEIRQSGLLAYQMVDGKRKVVPAGFKQQADGTVTIAVGEFDGTLPLIIDPLVYGSYYGGDSGFDDVRAVVSDSSGVYLTGYTQAPDFPAIQGPYTFNLQGPMDAFVSKLQGDAYSHDYAAYISGTGSEVGKFIQIDPFGDVWVAGVTDSLDFPGNLRGNVFILQGDSSATGGTFDLTFGGETVTLPYNANASMVKTALEGITGLAGNVAVTGTSLPGGTLRINIKAAGPLEVNSAGMAANYFVSFAPDGVAQQLTPTAVTAGTFTLTFKGETTAAIAFDATVTQVQDALNALSTINGEARVQGGPLADGTNPGLPMMIRFAGNMRFEAQPAFVIDTSALTGAIVVDALTSQFIATDRDRASVPRGGTYSLGFVGDVTNPLGHNASGADVQAALEALPGVGVGNVFATGSLPVGRMQVIFFGALTGAQPELAMFGDDLTPDPEYVISSQPAVFAVRFKQSDTTVLDPLPAETYVFGPVASLNSLVGFKIVPKNNPASTDPVELVFAGTGRIDELPTVADTVASWLYRVNYTSAGFAIQAGSQYLQGTTVNVALRGLDVDDEGSAYLVGTVATPGIVDTSVDDRFVTTPGVYAGGRLLRLADAFIRKVTRNGTLAYSALLGGNGSDHAMAVAVDGGRNAYITGLAGSFNFPRTRDVFGENFPPNSIVYVTKVNQDASQLLYSTHLNTSGPVQPMGIAVDQAGRAFVSLLVDFSMTFPFPPADPNQPTAITPGTIPTTTDAMQATNVQPATPDMGSLEGGLLVLSPNARTLVHGTYIGGILDDVVYAPYTDRFGDVWLMGYTENFRQYQRVSTTGAVTTHTQSAGSSLPAQWLSSTAFKRTADARGTTNVTKLYGLKESPFTAPPTITAAVRQDGFLVKLRFGLAAIQDVTFAPDQIAGGLGNVATGTVTLTEAAPAGGLDVTLTILNPAGASFSVAGDVSTSVLTIPGGATTATFSVFPKAVNTLTPVEIRASAEGNFAVGVLTVTPWLASLSISPNTVVGGNAATGRVRLFEPAPTGGVNVTLTTNNAGLVLIPTVVTVPEGQDSVPFTIDTNGVMNVSAPTVTASLFGVGRTETITLLPPSLATLTFTPSRVAGGTSSTGRLVLNGKAGGNFTVNLGIDAGTAGYTITPNTLTFANGDTFKEFTVNTAFETTDTQRRITATRPAQGGLNQQAISGTLFIDAVSLTTFTVDKVALNLGENGTGTITINRPAPAGGVVVNVSATSGIVEVPSQVIVPVGETEVTFNYRATTRAVVQNTTVTITATRGPVTLSRNVTVLPTTLSVTVDPFLVVAGTSAQGTVRLGAAAPAGGIVVNLSSNTTGVNVPATVTIPANQTTATFTVTTVARTTDVVATIRATTGTLTAQTTLNVLAEFPFDILGVQFDQPSVMGGMNVTCTVTIDAPAPPAGLVIQLESSNSRVVPVPATITVQNGKVVATFTINTAKVSRDLSVRVTARYKDSVASGVLQVRRR